MAEVRGQRPYFRNGPETDPGDAVRFRKALAQDRDEAPPRAHTGQSQGRDRLIASPPLRLPTM